MNEVLKPIEERTNNREIGYVEDPLEVITCQDIEENYCTNNKDCLICPAATWLARQN